MAYGDVKNLPKKTASDKVLCDKDFNIGKYTKYHRYLRGLISMVHNFFHKRSTSFAEKSSVDGAVTCANKSAITSRNLLNE